jgi:hypothetical protein
MKLAPLLLILLLTSCNNDHGLEGCGVSAARTIIDIVNCRAWQAEKDREDRR